MLHLSVIRLSATQPAYFPKPPRYNAIHPAASLPEIPIPCASPPCQHLPKTYLWRDQTWVAGGGARAVQSGQVERVAGWDCGWGGKTKVGGASASVWRLPCDRTHFHFGLVG